MIKVLYFGDIVGKTGRRALESYLEKNRGRIKPDLIIANIDNVSSGKGPTFKAYEEMIGLGIDVLTCGDHIWDYKEVVNLLEEKNSKLIRPYNYPDICPGKGFIKVNVKGTDIVVASMLGRIWTKEGLESPFFKTDELLKNINSKIIIVDFHAEATSEKYAYAWDFAGKVSAIIGSHTHVQTVDARIFEGFTGYITDVGFCGPKDSVIGVKPKESIKTFRTGIKTTLEPAQGISQINALILKIDQISGKTLDINPVNEFNCP